MRLTAKQCDEADWFRATIRAVMPMARVVADVEGWPMVLGRLGRVETALARWPCRRPRTLLAVYTDRMRMVSKLLAIPGVRRHQVGEREARLLFLADDPQCLRDVLRVIGARRRRLGGAGNLAGLAKAQEARRRRGDTNRTYGSRVRP